MKEKILELLNKNNYPHAEMDDDELCASEITAMVMEFVEWISFGSHPFVVWVDDISHYYTDELTPQRWSIEDLFAYWLTNIYKK